MDLRTTWITVPNPVIVGAAGITETLDRMKRAEDAGAGAVVVKSLFEDPVPRRGDPTPHMRIVQRELGGRRTFALYSFEQCAHRDEYGYAEEIRRAKQALGIPVIASIDCLTPDGWVRYARLCEQAGADAIEVKSCPHGMGMMSAEETVRVVHLVRQSVSIPVIAKLGAQLGDPVGTAGAAESAGAAAVVMFNRFSGLDIDVESERPIMHGGIAGFGGPWFIHYSLRWIAEAVRTVRVPVIGSGGVSGGEDVVKYLLAGATAVQVVTAILLEGYEAIGRIVGELARWMEEKGYGRVEEFRGKATAQLKGPDQVDRRRHLVARIEPGTCTGCETCARVCFRGAVTPAGSTFEVLPERCVGCGLCAELCPAAAVCLVRAGTAGEGKACG